MKVSVSEYHKKAPNWILIHGKVYDITKFKVEHPGGEEILLEHQRKDVGEYFDDIHHSDHAMEELKKLYVGDLEK